MAIIKLQSLLPAHPLPFVVKPASFIEVYPSWCWSPSAYTRSWIPRSLRSSSRLAPTLPTPTCWRAAGFLSASTPWKPTEAGHFAISECWQSAKSALFAASVCRCTAKT